MLLGVVRRQESGRSGAGMRGGERDDYYPQCCSNAATSSMNPQYKEEHDQARLYDDKQPDVYLLIGHADPAP